jgi:hypothetical protein
MANQPKFETTEHGKSAMDYDHHHKTYGLFVGLTKWVIIAAIVILAAMAFMLT